MPALVSNYAQPLGFARLFTPRFAKTAPFTPNGLGVGRKTFWAASTLILASLR